jgi:hypothetical protein
MTPANIAISSPIIHVSVVRALRHSGGLKTGTAFDIASMPVIAVDPDANARSTSSSPIPSDAFNGGVGVAWNPRPAACPSPTATSMAIAAMNA